MTIRLANNFDGLRLLGALMVLFSHQLALSGRPDPTLLGVKLGTLGVMIFFVISGYLVANSWERDPHIFRFSIKRMLRVWPALAVCLTITIGLYCLTMSTSEDRVYIPTLLFNYLPNYVFVWTDAVFFKGNPYPYLNASLWTIPIEVQCYVALAVLGLAANRYLHYVLIGLVGAIAALQLTNNLSQVIELLPRFFQLQVGFNLPAFFLAGTLMYFLPVLRSLTGTIALVFLGLTAEIAGQSGIAFSVLVPVVVLRIGLASWPFFRSAARFGDLSYGIYLWAWPIEQFGVAILGRETNWPTLLALTLTATVSMAYLSWHLVEKRCIGLKPVQRHQSLI